MFLLIWWVYESIEYEFVYVYVSSCSCSCSCSFVHLVMFMFICFCLFLRVYIYLFIFIFSMSEWVRWRRKERAREYEWMSERVNEYESVYICIYYLYRIVERRTDELKYIQVHISLFCYITLHCITSHYTPLHYTTLHYPTIHCFITTPPSTTLYISLCITLHIAINITIHTTKQYINIHHYSSLYNTIHHYLILSVTSYVPIHHYLHMSSSLHHHIHTISISPLQILWLLVAQATTPILLTISLFI